MTRDAVKTIISNLIALGLTVGVYFESGIWTAIAVFLAFFRINALGAATVLYAEKANKAFLSLHRELDRKV